MAQWVIDLARPSRYAGRTMPTRQELLAYQKLEKQMAKLFRHFGDLCKHCFDTSVVALRERHDVDRRELCCCLVDNQVQDHWQTLNAAQTAMSGPNWSRQLEANDQSTIDVGRRRLPGNGPCPALSCTGCILNSFRPPTCSTQLCPKMLRILNELGVVAGPTSSPRQIEEIADITSPLNALFGLNKTTATAAEIDRFSQAIDDLDRDCRQIPPEQWAAAIQRSKEHFTKLCDA